MVGGFRLHVLMCLTSALVTAGMPSVAQEARWPSKPIRIIVPYAPGGAVDATARILQEQLAEELGQTIIVDNKAGGATIPASEALVRSAPDGYTIGVFGSAWAANASIQKNLTFDPIKDITPISQLANSTTLLLVHPSSPYQTMAQLIAAAKAKPGELSYASTGVGTAQHFAAELFQHRAGIKMIHVPYRGAGPAVTDALGGQIPISFIGTGPTKPLVDTGKLRALAVTTDPRSKILPNVPTIAEQGLKDFNHGEWFCVIAPAGLQANITSALHAAVTKIVRSPRFSERVAALGAEAQASNTPDDFKKFVISEIERLRQLVQEAKIEIQ